MHSKSDNVEIMISNKADEIRKLLDSLKNRYKRYESINGSDFVFDYIR